MDLKKSKAWLKIGRHFFPLTFWNQYTKIHTGSCQGKSFATKKFMSITLPYQYVSMFVCVLLHDSIAYHYVFMFVCEAPFIININQKEVSRHAKYIKD